MTMTTTLVATTSPPATAGVSVSATILFNNNSVTINSQSITDLKKNGLVFSLTNPLQMGTFLDLVDWMHGQLHFPLTGDQVVAYIAEVPEPFETPLQSLAHAHVTLTVLNINTKTSLYQVAASIAPQPPLNILDILQVTAIGIQVSSAGKSTSP
jgi:hypothetical protein